MKKIALAVLLASGLMAADSGMYVGFDVGSTEYDYDVSLNGGSEGGTDDGGSATLKVGYYFDKNSRVYGSYQNVNTDGGDTFSVSVGYDYLYGSNDFKPFVGVIAGYGSSSDDDGVMDISGAVYGAQVGVNYAFNANFSAEAGYRYMKSNMEDSMSEEGVDVKVEIDPISNWFVGVNYKF